MMYTLNQEDISNIANILHEEGYEEYYKILEQMAEVMCHDDEIKIDDAVYYTHG